MTACGGDPAARVEGKAAHGTAEVGGRIVSTVDGHPIVVGQVEALSADGLAPRVALERLQAELLLASEAERRGYDADREAVQVARQAMVQALLARAVESQPVTEQEIQAWYEAGGERWNRPERRGAVHVLASVGEDPSPEADDAGREFARRVIAEMRSASDPATLVDRYKDSERPLFKVVAERVPPIGEAASFAEPYKRAIFSLSDVGVVPEPVKTKFGWHAIAVDEIVPALHLPLEEARDQVAAEVKVDKQRKRLAALEQELRKTYGVEVAERVGEALASVEP